MSAKKATKDNPNDSGKLNVPLTDEEQRALLSAMERIQSDVVKKTLAEVRIYLLFVAGILTFFGFFTLSGVRSDVVKTTADRFMGNGAIKQEIVDNAQELLMDATNILDKVQKREEELDTEAARMGKSLASEIIILRKMVQQIRMDAEKAANSQNIESTM